MGNNSCQQQHNRQLSDVNALLTEENLNNNESELNLASKITERVYQVNLARNELVSRLQLVPTETLLYIAEIVLQLSLSPVEQLKAMLPTTQVAYQALIGGVIKWKQKSQQEPSVILSEQVNNFKLLYELVSQPYQQLHHRPIYDDEYKLVREITIKRYRNNYVIKEDTVKDPVVTQKRIENWLLLSQAKHPNLLNLKAAVITASKARFLTEYIDGVTLDKIILKKMAYAEKTCLATQMIDALKQVHTSGYIHGDIKLSNFMVANSLVVLMDLDQLSPEPQSADMTYIYSIGEKSSFQGDLWALGLCLYQLFFEQKIEKGWTIKEYMNRDFPLLQITSYGRIQPILEATLSQTPCDVWHIASLAKYL